jgi:hypothetical protein
MYIGIIDFLQVIAKPPFHRLRKPHLCVTIAVAGLELDQTSRTFVESERIFCERMRSLIHL